MTDDNSSTGGESTDLVDMNDLDAFSSSYFDPKVTTIGAPVEETPKDGEASETEDDALATDEDNHEDEDKGENVEPEPKPQGKKSAQERINEVVAKQREAERERDALRQKIAELEAAATKKPEEVKTQGQTPLREQLAADAPSPDALNEDGSPKYKLGEFDPQYIRDLTKYTITVEREAQREADARAAERMKVEAAQAELQSNWLQKLEQTEKELPDIREHITDLENQFSNLPADYGEFLAATIMSCDNGPEVMYYLSQNIGEAQKIVASGPAAATLALGRLDARLSKAAAQEEKSNKRPSEAPEPPPSTTRGNGGRFSARPDTENLAAFEKEFYAKK